MNQGFEKRYQFGQQSQATQPLFEIGLGQYGFNTQPSSVLAWNGLFEFENTFLRKFASTIRRDTWYMKYKAYK